MMMKMVTIVCDRCKEGAGFSEWTAWEELITARESGWHIIKGKHICPECYEKM